MIAHRPLLKGKGPVSSQSSSQRWSAPPMGTKSFKWMVKEAKWSNWGHTCPWNWALLQALEWLQKDKYLAQILCLYAHVPTWNSTEKVCMGLIRRARDSMKLTNFEFCPLPLQHVCGPSGVDVWLARFLIIRIFRKKTVCITWYRCITGQEFKCRHTGHFVSPAVLLIWFRSYHVLQVWRWRVLSNPPQIPCWPVF